MKHTFSLPSKSKPKGTASADENSAADDGNKKEIPTECDPSKTLADAKPKYVIAPIENTWWTHKKMKNLDLPLQSANTGSGLEFEPEVSLGDSQGSDNITYGLNLRQKAKDDAASNFASDTTEDRKVVPVEQLLLQSLRKDLESLADDPTLDDYESVPVEGFGAALLAGYGWKPGQGIGKNAKEDVQVKEYKRWNAQGEGLGFDPDRSRVSDTKAQGEENGKLEKPRDVDVGDAFFVGKEVRIVVGRVSDTKAQGEENGKLEKPRDVDVGDVFFVGKEVRIVGGREIGLKSKIVEKLGTDFSVLNLSGSEREVQVGVDEVADVGSLEEEKCLKNLKVLQVNDKEKDGQTRERKEKPLWLRSHIRVRVISKGLKSGTLYLKKGKVVDVVGPTSCNIMMDDTQELVEGVDQKLLETALPRPGGPVLVLSGRHKGVYGHLVEKDLDKETGVVRDLDNQKMLDVGLEQVAEYLGDMDDNTTLNRSC